MSGDLLTADIGATWRAGSVLGQRSTELADVARELRSVGDSVDNSGWCGFAAQVYRHRYSSLPSGLQSVSDGDRQVADRLARFAAVAQEAQGTARRAQTQRDAAAARRVSAEGRLRQLDREIAAERIRLAQARTAELLAAASQLTTVGHTSPETVRRRQIEARLRDLAVSRAAVLRERQAAEDEERAAERGLRSAEDGVHDAARICADDLDDVLPSFSHRREGVKDFRDGIANVTKLVRAPARLREIYAERLKLTRDLAQHRVKRAADRAERLITGSLTKRQLSFLRSVDGAAGKVSSAVKGSAPKLGSAIRSVGKFATSAPAKTALRRVPFFGWALAVEDVVSGGGYTGWRKTVTRLTAGAVVVTGVLATGVVLGVGGTALIAATPFIAGAVVIAGGIHAAWSLGNLVYDYSQTDNGRRRLKPLEGLSQRFTGTVSGLRVALP